MLVRPLLCFAGSCPAAGQSVEPVDRLDALVIEDDREITDAERTGLPVDVVETERYANTVADLADVVKRTPGVVVRESGGLGSTVDISLNGLSGRQVRYFLDGIPTENFGPALTLDNFPVSLVERIDVYKGVVPIGLGADALGGAIDIITAPRDETLVDASLSAGSFGTARAALVAQVARDDGWFVRLNAFANRSDNDYRMRNVPVEDELGNRIGVTDARRFHDAYRSAMFNVRIGMAGRGALEELSIGVTVAGNRDQEQHPDTSVNEVYGRVENDNETALGSLVWKQRFGATSVKAYALGGRVVTTAYDTASRDYDWFGDFTPGSNPTQGEIGTRSVFELQDDVVRGSLGLRHRMGENAALVANLSTDRLDRSGNDRLDANNTSFTFPNSLHKSVAGLAWEQAYRRRTLRTSVFAKHYRYDAVIDAARYVQGRFVQTRTRAGRNATGYGASAALDVGTKTTLSVSYEHAYRLPEPDETLGSGKYIRPNPDLLPERSDNLNLGLDVRPYHALLLRTGLFQRRARDFIRYVPDRLVYGVHENVARVQVRGVEAFADWNPGAGWFASAAATWQRLSDETGRAADGTINRNAGDRLPNEPYLFGNLRAGYGTDWPNGARASAAWSINYVHAFFLNQASAGARDAKFEIPDQLVHDLDLDYVFGKGVWNLSLSLRNLFDEAVFDNYAIQKPGRAAYLKLRWLY